MFLFNREVKTYTIKAPNGIDVVFDAETNLIIPNGRYPNDKHPHLTKSPDIKAKMILDARGEMDKSPYKNYKPLIYKKDSIMNGFRGYSNANLYVANWKKIYLKGSMRGNKIAPWTNSEKAYYESLDGRGRYDYLVIRSGLESSIITKKEYALRQIDRPKEKVYIQTYDEAREEYIALLRMIQGETFYAKSSKEVNQIYITRHNMFISVIKKLSFVYEKSGDYKAGLLLAEVYMNDNYYVAKVLSASEKANRRATDLCPLLRAIEPFIREKTKKAVNILLELIEAYNLPDAYYGMYLYHAILDPISGLDEAYRAPNIVKTPEYWLDLALKYGSYDAFESLSDRYNDNLFNAEYCLAMGILGNNAAFHWATNGFNRWGFATRKAQAEILAIQLGFENTMYMREEFSSILKKIPKDKYGLRPFFTEYIDISFYEELNRTNYEGDPSYLRWQFLQEKVKQGKLLDPTDKKATKESREAYRKVAMNWYQNPYDAIGFKEEWQDYVIERHSKRVVLRAKILSITPPQGYPNAPFYYFPEEIDEKFEKGELDFNLDPRIPAIYRISFPPEIRQKILEYARKHNIKDDEINY